MSLIVDVAKTSPLWTIRLKCPWNEICNHKMVTDLPLAAEWIDLKQAFDKTNKNLISAMNLRHYSNVLFRFTVRSWVRTISGPFQAAARGPPCVYRFQRGAFAGWRNWVFWGVAFVWGQLLSLKVQGGFVATGSTTRVYWPTSQTKKKLFW